jgi:hypothetical protein
LGPGYEDSGTRERRGGGGSGAAREEGGVCTGVDDEILSMSRELESARVRDSRRSPAGPPCGGALSAAPPELLEGSCADDDCGSDEDEAPVRAPRSDSPKLFDFLSTPFPNDGTESARGGGAAGASVGVVGELVVGGAGNAMFSSSCVRLRLRL